MPRITFFGNKTHAHLHCFAFAAIIPLGLITQAAQWHHTDVITYRYIQEALLKLLLLCFVVPGERAGEERALSSVTVTVTATVALANKHGFTSRFIP